MPVSRPLALSLTLAVGASLTLAGCGSTHQAHHASVARSARPTATPAPNLTAKQIENAYLTETQVFGAHSGAGANSQSLMSAVGYAKKMPLQAKAGKNFRNFWFCDSWRWVTMSQAATPTPNYEYFKGAGTSALNWEEHAAVYPTPAALASDLARVLAPPSEVCPPLNGAPRPVRARLYSPYWEEPAHVEQLTTITAPPVAGGWTDHRELYVQALTGQTSISAHQLSGFAGRWHEATVIDVYTRGTDLVVEQYYANTKGTDYTTFETRATQLLDMQIAGLNS